MSFFFVADVWFVIFTPETCEPRGAETLPRLQISLSLQLLVTDFFFIEDANCISTVSCRDQPLRDLKVQALHPWIGSNSCMSHLR